ncbi:MAG TPA: ATP-dependent helicase, partial [Thermodesulfobacteriota bacterium]|nr:ATP-dependent helicase [Thermodesulfobacteriota bacterium]
GPLVVLAGPGTGKTRTLTYRLALMLARGKARSDQILAITFTNKAAEELRSRIDNLCLGINLSSPPRVTTFHGFCFRFLRDHLSLPFQLLAEQEAQTFLRETVKTLRPDFPGNQIKELGRRISLVKNTFTNSESSGNLPSWEDHPEWGALYRAYQGKMVENQLIDFDDLLLKTILMLENDPVLLKQLQNRFPYVFVDEFQDINPAQYRLFELLTRPEGEWMIIGDPNQAIYGFRGASAGFFLAAKSRSPSLKEIILSDTFRVPGKLLKASLQVLAGSPGNHIFPMRARNQGELKIPVAALSWAEEEAEYIAGLIGKEMGGLDFNSTSSESSIAAPRGFADFAVLYRLHAQGERFAQVFSKKGIPFKIVREIHWAERPEIRTCLRLLRSLPGLSLSPLEALAQVLSRDNPDLHPKVLEGIEALKKLHLWASTFKGPLEEFLEILAIQTGLDTYEPDQETVKLMTLHSAKGLEFQVVFMAGCEENLLPLSLLKESDTEEERRLFYVGMTRPREKLFFSWAKRRTLFGHKLVQSISPFIEDIDGSLKERAGLTLKPQVKPPRKKQLSLFK